tara:strand:+ start:168 stop:350 length:183 start_codon:yes stop_codon:yes gene_type:complete
MKKIIFLIALVFASMSFISCNNDTVAETDAMYQNLSATEGDDGDIENDPDEEEPVEPIVP